MRVSGLLLVGLVAMFAVFFMLFSVDVFDDGISGRVTGVCNSFSVDSDVGFYSKGSSIVSGCVAASVSDFCVNPCVVGEYVNSNLVYFNCSNGCVDGACLQSASNPSLAQYCADRAGDQKLIEDCDNQLDDDTDGDVDCDDNDCDGNPLCPVDPYCGDGTCNAGVEEDCNSCFSDCGGCTNLTGQWEQIGPGGGGWFRSVRFHPSNSNIVYLAGDANGGFWKSYDGGRTWNTRNTGLYNMHLEDIAVSENTVIVASRGGVYKSTDAGETWQYKWQSITGPLVRDGVDNPLGWIASVHISPKNPQLMLAGSGGHHPVWSHPSFLNVYRSTDSGETWGISNAGILESDKTDNVVFAFSSDPNNVNVVFMSTRKALYKSINAGVSWTKVWNNGAWFVAVDPKNSNTVFALKYMNEYSNTGPNVYKSSDGGLTWVLSSNGIADKVIGEEIHFDPLNTNNLYFSERMKDNIYKSTNGGQSWVSIGPSKGEFVSTSFDVLGGKLIKAPDMFVSFNDGQSWERTWATDMGNGYLKGTGAELLCVSHVAIHPTIPGKLYMVVYDSGLWESLDYGNTWKHLKDVQDTYTVKTRSDGTPYRCYSGSYMAFDKNNPDIIYLGMRDNELDDDGETSGVIIKSTDGGKTWNEVRGLPSERVIHNILTLKNGAIFAYTQWDGLYRSTDQGTTWNRVDNQNGHQLSGVVLPDPQNENILYETIMWTGLFKSTNGGDSGSWIKKADGIITNPVSMSIGSDGTIWILQAGGSAGVFKSTNGGDLFTKVFTLETDEEGFPGRNLVDYTSIVVDPKDPNTVYMASKDFYDGLVAKGVGVYVTRDGGATWRPMNDGLTQKFVKSLTIDPVSGTLYAGTYCHGVFRLNMNN